MKILSLLVAGLLALIASPCHAQNSIAWSSDYDPVLAPLSKGELNQVLQRNKNNAGELLKLIEKSKALRFGDSAFRTLEVMRVQHPNSVDTQAAYCWAYLQYLDSAYVKGGDYKPHTKQQDTAFKDAWARAGKLSPRHWMVLFNKGYKAYVRGTNNFKVALPLLKEATEQAPDDRYVRGFCWGFYGAAHNGAARTRYMHEGKTVTFKDAANVMETAVKIDPRQTAIWLTLFMKYHYNLKDKAGALRAKRGFLKAYPKERLPKLQKWIKDLFALYPD